MISFIEREILPQTHLVCSALEPIVLKTLDLQHHIAFTFFAPAIGKAGMAREMDPHTLDVLFRTLLSDKKINNIDVSFVGGDHSKESEEKAAALVWKLNGIDADRNIINIIAFDVGPKRHPESFLFSCNSGKRYLVKE